MKGDNFLNLIQQCSLARVKLGLSDPIMLLFFYDLLCYMFLSPKTYCYTEDHNINLFRYFI